MENGFKLIENENGVFLTYVLAGGMPCDAADQLSVARAMDKVKSHINSQMVDFVWSISQQPVSEEPEQSEEVIKIIDNELNSVENEGTEI